MNSSCGNAVGVHVESDTCDKNEMEESSFNQGNDYDYSCSIADFSERPREADNHSVTGAERLVRSEAIAVRFLRGSVIVLLVAATAMTGVFTHRLSLQNQIDTFTRDFEALAERMVVQFESGIGSFLYQANTLSYAISGGLFAGFEPKFPEVTLADFDRLATGLRYQARALDVVWSPLLNTKSELYSWEAYAASVQNRSSSSTTGQNQPCNLCGDGNELANPNNQYRIPGIGIMSCEIVQQGALNGFLTSSDCAAAKMSFMSACGCKPSTETKTQEIDPIWEVSNGVFRLDKNGTAVKDRGPAPFSPVWQFSPNAAGENGVMFNQMSDPSRRKALNAMIQHNIPVFSESFDPTTNAFYHILRTPAAQNGIVGVLFYPVYESAQSNEIAGSLAVDFAWKTVFEIGLTSQSDGMVVVLGNSCGQDFTFQVNENQIVFIGNGDLHDTSFDSLVVESSIDRFLQLVSSISPRGAFQNISSNWVCAYNIRVYPSNEMKSKYLTSKPWVDTSVVISIFLFTSVVFLLYDFILRRLQAKVMKSAKRSEAIVSSMFPAVVRDRVYGNDDANEKDPSNVQHTNVQRKQSFLGNGTLSHRVRLKNFLEQSSDDVIKDPEPIADLFPDTTILFADIAGFTAWSSEREPAQVFKLLETIYGAFDQIANKLGVFKIETIGDCYVAVAGLPEPCEDHAVVMVKFAFDCLIRMGDLAKQLESSLGPGTGDLAIRVGLHSGPVTGGVLRGERARFQLFGDTMNTASRMESNGKFNHIHVSSETANLLIKAGKSSWVEKREEKINVKGKGDMQTYWVRPSKSRQRKASISKGTSSEVARSPSGTTTLEANLSIRALTTSNRRDRLIAWNTEILEPYLQKIIARRKALSKYQTFQRLPSVEFDQRQRPPETTTQVLNDICEIIRMPEFNEQVAIDEMNSSLIDIGANARSQLRDYVSNIAALYHDNAFHNFEHASHVVMSATKLLKRILARDNADYCSEESGKTMKDQAVVSKEIHDSTYGISSDPLMQFAVLFSALIHDVDHTGLQNRQLVKKNDPLAISYLSKCVAEQHSIQCAWNMLMEDRYAELRQCIYQTEEDRVRFRQLVINAVIATDIADTELQFLRQNRWDKAFHESDDGSTMHRKATLLFEYILQASDIAPTMKPWHFYHKWNQRLFEERYIAYVMGNDEEDPSISWYNDEIAFFDNYVIPLARNLEASQLFGVSCDDYLAYALENRREWETKGEEIVNDMVAAHKTLMTHLGSAKELSDSV